MQFRHKVHVLYRKEELDHEKLEGKVAIVLDVLFATSTIITAMSNGVKEVIPTLDEAGRGRRRKSIRQAATFLPASSMPKRCPGSRRRPAGSARGKDRRAQVDLFDDQWHGRVTAIVAADHVYAGALLNGEAVVNHVLDKHPGKTILIVCSVRWAWSTSKTCMAPAISSTCCPARSMRTATFRCSAGGAQPVPQRRCRRLPVARARRAHDGRANLVHEVHFAARLSVFDAVPVLEGGRLLV